MQNWSMDLNGDIHFKIINKKPFIRKEKVKGRKVMNHHCKSVQKEKLVHKNAVG